MPRNRGKSRARKQSRAPLARLDANATASAAEAPPDMSPDGDVVLDDVHEGGDQDAAAAGSDSDAGDAMMPARGLRDRGKGGVPRSVSGVHDMDVETRVHETVAVRL